MFEADIGKAIKKLRGSRTRREVAKKAGIHSTAWSSHERGKRALRRTTLRKIVRGLGCTPEQFEVEVCQQVTDRLGAKLQRQAALAPEAAPKPGETADPSIRPIHEHAQAAAYHFATMSVLLNESLVAELVRALRPDAPE